MKVIHPCTVQPDAYRGCPTETAGGSHYLQAIMVYGQTRCKFILTPRSYSSVGERSVHTGKVAGSIPARTTISQPAPCIKASAFARQSPKKPTLRSLPPLG
ncbi:hypothetical protein U2A4042610041 [Corynebacterium striatum]|nr:hypothetical protein U2A4042610041 [Corynebacterium striatum]